MYCPVDRSGVCVKVHALQDQQKQVLSELQEFLRN